MTIYSVTCRAHVTATGSNPSFAPKRMGHALAGQVKAGPKITLTSAVAMSGTGGWTAFDKNTGAPGTVAVVTTTAEAGTHSLLVTSGNIGGNPQTVAVCGVYDFATSTYTTPTGACSPGEQPSGQVWVYPQSPEDPPGFAPACSYIIDYLDSAGHSLSSLVLIAGASGLGTNYWQEIPSGGGGVAGSPAPIGTVAYALRVEMTDVDSFFIDEVLLSGPPNFYQGFESLTTTSHAYLLPVQKAQCSASGACSPARHIHSVSSRSMSTSVTAAAHVATVVDRQGTLQSLPDDVWLEWAPGTPISVVDPPWQRMNSVTGPGLYEPNGLVELEYDRGIERVAKRVDPGTLTVRMRNLNRLFDPFNRQSPYWPWCGTGAPIRLMVRVGHATLQLWRGRTTSMVPAWGGGSGPGVGYAEVDIKAVDITSELTKPLLTPDWYSQVLTALEPADWWPLDEAVPKTPITTPAVYSYENLQDPANPAIVSGGYEDGPSLVPWSSSSKSVKLTGQQLASGLTGQLWLNPRMSQFSSDPAAFGYVGPPVPGNQVFTLTFAFQVNGVLPGATNIGLAMFRSPLRSQGIDINQDPTFSGADAVGGWGAGSLNGTPNPGLTFTWEPDQRLGAQVDGIDAGGGVAVGSALALGVPHHVVVSYNVVAGRVTLTVDGTTVQSAQAIDTVQTDAGWPVVAQLCPVLSTELDPNALADTNLQNLDLQLAHVAWWPGEFTASQAQALYTAWNNPQAPQTTGQRIEAMLELSPLANFPRRIEAGTQVMGPIHWDGTRKSRSNATWLDEISKAANTELGVGRVYANAAGTVCFDAYGHFRTVWPALDSEVNLYDVEVAADDQTFFTDIQLGVSSKSTVTYEYVAPTADLLGTITYSEATDFYDQAAAVAAAPFYTSGNATPGIAYSRPVLTKAVIKGGTMSWLYLLVMEIGDWVPVVLHVPSTFAGPTGSSLTWGGTGGQGWGGEWEGEPPVVQLSNILRVGAKVDFRERTWEHELYLFPVSG